MSSGGPAGMSGRVIGVNHATVTSNLELGGRLGSRLGRLDMLVNNVGGLVPSRVTTGDGYELTLALNFLAPVVLTRSLLPLMLASDSARCVNVISSAFTIANGDPLDDPDRAAASCTALVIAPASDIDGRYFDGRKPHRLPRRVLDPDLRERVLQLGQDLADRAAG